MANSEDNSWLVLRIEEVEAGSFEIQKVSRLLNDLSSALFSIARKRIGMPTDRPGPRTPAEERVAGFRLVKITEGSLLIELAPPVSEPQARFDLQGDASAEDVAYDFYRTVEDIAANRPLADSDRNIVRRVMTVVQDIADIGPRLDIKFHPLSPNRFPKAPRELHAVLNTRMVPELLERATKRERRRLIGHTFMVDVEPGKERIRLKLSDGRDITLGVDQGAADNLESALNRVVEVEIDEEHEEGGPTKRTIQQLDIVQSETDDPPKTLSQLEEEQNLPVERPDYVRLASAVWKTQEDVEHFNIHVREIRRAGTS